MPARKAATNTGNQDVLRGPGSLSGWNPLMLPFNCCHWRQWSRVMITRNFFLKRKANDLAYREWHDEFQLRRMDKLVLAISKRFGYCLRFFSVASSRWFHYELWDSCDKIVLGRLVLDRWTLCNRFRITGNDFLLKFSNMTYFQCELLRSRHTHAPSTDTAHITANDSLYKNKIRRQTGVRNNVTRLTLWFAESSRGEPHTSTPRPRL